MKVYLVQHGTSSPEDEDPQKGLTSQAVADVEKIARFIGQMDQQYEAVFIAIKKSEIVMTSCESMDGRS